jgi:hypothetical protein
MREFGTESNGVKSLIRRLTNNKRSQNQQSNSILQYLVTHLLLLLQGESHYTNAINPVIAQ